MGDIDDFLAKIEAEQAKKAKPQQDLLDTFQAKFVNKKEVNNQINDFVAKATTEIESKQQDKLKQRQNPELFLQEIEQKIKEKKARISQPLPSENIEAIKNQELNEQRKKKAMMRQAEEWLKRLDPYSDEGIWFEEFAYSYESKLAAAIDYLAALGETKSKLL